MGGFDGWLERVVTRECHRSSVSVIEVLDGLQPGDQVILSDMAAWDGHERVRLE